MEEQSFWGWSPAPCEAKSRRFDMAVPPSSGLCDIRALTVRPQAWDVLSDMVSWMRRLTGSHVVWQVTDGEPKGSVLASVTLLAICAHDFRREWERVD